MSNKIRRLKINLKSSKNRKNCNNSTNNKILKTSSKESKKWPKNKNNSCINNTLKRSWRNKTTTITLISLNSLTQSNRSKILTKYKTFSPCQFLTMNQLLKTMNLTYWKSIWCSTLIWALITSFTWKILTSSSSLSRVWISKWRKPCKKRSSIWNSSSLLARKKIKATNRIWLNFNIKCKK